MCKYAVSDIKTTHEPYIGVTKGICSLLISSKKMPQNQTPSSVANSRTPSEALFWMTCTGRTECTFTGLGSIR